MDLGPHAGFIWASYGITALVVATLVIRAILQERGQRQILARLETQGIKRRSDAHNEDGQSR